MYWHVHFDVIIAAQYRSNRPVKQGRWSSECCSSSIMPYWWTPPTSAAAAVARQTALNKDVHRQWYSSFGRSAADVRLSNTLYWPFTVRIWWWICLILGSDDCVLTDSWLMNGEQFLRSKNESTEKSLCSDFGILFYVGRFDIIIFAFLFLKAKLPCIDRGVWTNFSILGVTNSTWTASFSLELFSRDTFSMVFTV